MKITSSLPVPAVHILAVIVLGFIVYSNTFHSPFTFDDKEIYIVKNLAIRDLRYFADTSALRSLPEFYAKDFFKTRFIGHLSFALNYRFNGLDVQGYHWVNLFIHIINAILVYRLALITFKTPLLREHQASPGGRNSIALVSALLFVCHPIQTQAVTYISQRITSLAAFFFLLSLVLYIKSRLSTKNRDTSQFSLTGKKRLQKIGMCPYFFYLLSLISAVLAMKTKEISFTLPVIIALYEFMFFDGKAKKRVLLLVPFMLTMLIIPYYFLSEYRYVGNPAGELRLLTDMPRTTYLLTQFTVIATYIRLLLFPADQNLDYDYPIYRSFFDPNVFLSFLFLLSLLGLGIYLLRRSRSSARRGNELSLFSLIAFGIFWFFITLSVESSIIPILDVIFEHRVYLPSVGFILALVAAAAALYRRFPVPVLSSLVLVLLLLSYSAYARNRVWTDEVRLWEDVVRKSPYKGRAHLNLGLAYEKQNRLEDAFGELRTALKLDPSNIQARNKLGVFYTKKNMAGEAAEEFRAVIALKPDYTDAHINLGVAYEKLNRLQDAMEEYQTALKLSPGNAEACNNIGALRLKQNRGEDAMNDFRTALKLNPFYADAHYNLGTIYAGRNRPGEALQEYQAALRIDPDHAEAHNNIGALYAGQGRWEEALAEFRTALKLKPGYADAYNNLVTVQSMKAVR